MLKLVKDYISNEDALDVSIQTILFVVIAIVVVAIIAGIAYSVISSGKGNAKEGQDKVNQQYSNLKGLW